MDAVSNAVAGVVKMNYLAILIAAVAYFVLGALWYSPVLFGNAWLKGTGKTKEQVAADHSPMNYVIGLVTAFVSSYGIARILLWTHQGSIAAGIKIGLFVGVCFTLMAFFMNDAFEHRPKSLTFVNALYHIVGCIIAGLIIGAF